MLHTLRFTIGLMVLAAACAAPTRPPTPEAADPTQDTAARPAWTRALGTPLARAPQIGDGLIYLAGKDNAIYAFDDDDGREVWRFQSEARLWDLSLAAAGDAVYVGVEGGALLALDADDGSPRWRWATVELSPEQGEVTYPPAAVAGMVFVPTAFVGTDIVPNFEGRARLFALDAATGDLQWQFETGNFILTQPTVDGGVVYAGGPFLAEAEDEEEGGHTRVYALRVEDGSLIWQAEVQAGLLKNLTIEAGVVSLMGYRDTLIGLAAEDGRARWEFETGNWVESFSTGGGLTYFGSATSTVYAVEVTTGRERWRHQLDGAFNYIIGGPAVAGGRLYFITTHSQIVALDAGTGEREWLLETDILARAPLATDGKRLYVAATDGRLYAYDAP